MPFLFSLGVGMTVSVQETCTYVQFYLQFLTRILPVYNISTLMSYAGCLSTLIQTGKHTLSIMTVMISRTWLGLWSLIVITPRFPESYLQKLYSLWAPTSLLRELKVKVTAGLGKLRLSFPACESLCLQNRCGMGRSGVNLSPLLLEITFNSDPKGPPCCKWRGN